MTTGDDVQDGSRLGLSAASTAAHTLPASYSSAAHAAITVITLQPMTGFTHDPCGSLLKVEKALEPSKGSPKLQGDHQGFIQAARRPRGACQLLTTKRRSCMLRWGLASSSWASAGQDPLIVLSQHWLLVPFLSTTGSSFVLVHGVCIVRRFVQLQVRGCG